MLGWGSNPHHCSQILNPLHHSGNSKTQSLIASHTHKCWESLPDLGMVRDTGTLFWEASPNVPMAPPCPAPFLLRQGWLSPPSAELLLLLGSLPLECPCFLFPRWLALVNTRVWGGCSCIPTSLTVPLPLLYRMKLDQVFFINIPLKNSLCKRQKPFKISIWTTWGIYPEFYNINRV